MGQSILFQSSCDLIYGNLALFHQDESIQQNIWCERKLNLSWLIFKCIDIIYYFQQIEAFKNVYK